MLRNCWLKWFENRMQYRRLTGRLPGRGRRSRRHRPSSAVVGEALEARTLLTTFFVDTTADVVAPMDGQTSLREAITMAEADATADIIRFAAGLEGAVFNITQGPLPTITEDLQILGTIGNAQTIFGAGLIVDAAGAGTTTTFAMNSVNIYQTPSGAGLQINATDDGVANVTIFNSRITNSAAQGINFVAHTGGVLNLRLASVAAISNGDVVQSEGIKGAVGVDPQGAESLTTPGNFATANLDFATITVANQFLEAFRLDVEDGGIVTTPNAIRNANFSNNGIGNQRSGVRFRVSDAGSSLQADFDGTVAHNATGTGYGFTAQAGASLDIGIASGASQGAKADALTFLVDNATATIDVDGFTALTNGDNGVEGRFTNGADVTFNTFNNVTITNPGNSGLKIGVLSGSTLGAFNATNVTISGSGQANNTSDASGALLTTLDSVSNFSFTNLTTNNNLVRGVQAGVNSGGTSTKTFNNLVATGNVLSHPIGIGVGNNSVLNTTINGGNLTSAGASFGINNVYMTATTGSTSNLTIDGVTMNGSTSSGIVANYDNSQGVMNVLNSTSTGNTAVGIALFVKNGADVDANFENVDVSGAGQTTPSSGMRIEVDGPGTTGDFTFNGVTADDAGGTGISLVYNNLAVGSVDQFDNVSAQNTGGDGVRVLVNGIGTTLSSFVANGVNVSGAGLGTNQNSNGLEITVAGPGAIGNFDLQDVTANVAGGRGIKLQVENTAIAQVDLDDFEASGNGLEGLAIDVGTVVAGAQLLGASFTNGSANSNGQAFMMNLSGIRSTVRGTGSAADLTFAGIFANSNTDDGLSLSGENGATFAVDLASGINALGNLGDGVDFRGDGPTTTVALSSSVGGNMFTGNGGVGLNVLLTNQVTANEITVQGIASLNQNDGVRIADDGSGVTINSLQVSGNSQMNDNQGDGLAIDLDGALGLTSLDLSSLSLSNNVGDQINVSLANMSLTDISLDGIMAIGEGAGAGGGDGIELSLDNTQVTNSLALNNIIATDNGEDGLELSFENDASIPLSSAIDVGTFNDNGQHGVNLSVANVTNSPISLSLTNSTAVMQNTVSSLSRNGMHGLNVRLDNADLTMDDVDRQTILANGGAGINILGATPSDFISGNTFTNNNISNNLSFGFRGVFNGGTFDITIGEAGAGNIFDNNTGAGIAIDQIQNSVGQLIIEDNQITDTNDGGTVFNGDGIFIRQLGTVNPQQATNVLTRMGGPGLLIQNNRIGVTNSAAADGNAGFGVTFQSEEQSSIDGLHVFENEISNNGIDGLSFRRFDQVAVVDFRIESNTFDANAGDGIEIVGQNDQSDPMQVIIGPDAPTSAELMTDSMTTALPAAPEGGNTITNNGGDGIRLQVNADARLVVDVRDNFLVNNSDDGVGLSEVTLDPSDGRQISGVWVQNTIADNGDRGVESRAFTGGVVLGGDKDPLAPVLYNPGSSPQAALGIYARENTIGAVLDQFGQVVPGQDGNGSTGIDVDRGISNWIGTSILRNGVGTVANRSVGHGVDVSGAAFVLLDDNLIRENFQDGVEVNVTGVSSVGVEMYRNRVQLNEGRGVDILTQDRGFSSVVLTNGAGRTYLDSSPNPMPVAGVTANNVVNSNVEEGIYQVLTASTSQNQSDFAAVTLAQDGSPTTSGPFAQLFVHNATVSNNGSTDVNNLVASAGIVIRVGTAGRTQLTAPRGTIIDSFATNGLNSNPVNSGVYAELVDSSLHGNFGDDVFIHGYTSTADPATVAGTWSDMMFNITNGNNSDPLSRIDLVWGLSDYDSVDVNNSLRRGTPGGQAGAFYNNAEGTFKSRAGNSTPGSPFNNSGTRRRNAQRVPARTLTDGSVLAPGNSPADFGRFLYPGMGESTFRVRSASGASLAPFGSVGFTGAIAGELPFTWGGFAAQKSMSTQRTYFENAAPITIDSGFGSIQDVNLDVLNGGQGNYDGATISVARQGGQPMTGPEDVYGFQNGSGLSLVGNTIQKAGSIIAFFDTTSTPGELLVTFTDAFGEIPTSDDADNVLRQITYANSSPVPPLPMPPLPSLTLNVTYSANIPGQLNTPTLCQVAIDIIPFNSQPQIVNWGPAGTFGGTPIKLDDDGNVEIVDPELDFLDNFATSVLTIRRQGGANADDVFTFQNGNGLTFNNGDINKNGETIATFDDDNGTLTISFTDADGEIPTAADADNILRQVCYENTNANPPANVTLQVNFNDNGVGGGMVEQTTAFVTVTSNQAPAITDLGPADVYITGGPAVTIDNNSNANITDVELDAADNYAGATLTIARQGGANADDTYTFTPANGLNLVGNEIRKAGQAIASFDIVNGTLTIAFTDANGETPTAADADNVLRQINYANTNVAPPASVVLVATFDDGGILGVGNQQTMASVTVNINTAPTITNFGPASNYTSGSASFVSLDNDGNANIADLELDNLDNYNSSTLTLVRQGGANANDEFSFTAGSGLSLVGTDIIKNGQAIASFNVVNGTLTIAFTDSNGEAPTSVDVDNVLQQITYRNTTEPVGNVTLDATFDDGGVAGAGAQQAMASVTVNIV